MAQPQPPVPSDDFVLKDGAWTEIYTWVAACALVVMLLAWPELATWVPATAK